MCPHYKVSPISRANGGSIVEKADYALCRGQHADKAAELVASGQAGPVIDWQAIAAAEDKSTRRATAKEGRSFVVALPNELDLPSLIQLAQDHADWARAEHGIVVEWGIQVDPNNPDNPHLHMATSSRRVDDAGVIGKKARELDVVKTGAIHVEAMRAKWESQVNTAMAAAGRPERLDMRSFARQGRTDEPTRHLGPVIAHRVAKDLPSERHSRNEFIRRKRTTRAAADRADRELDALICQGADQAVARVHKRVGNSQRLAGTATHVRAGRQRHAATPLWGGNLAASAQRQEHQTVVPDGAARREHRPAEVQRALGSDGRRDRADELAAGGGGTDRVQPRQSGLAGSPGAADAKEVITTPVLVSITTPTGDVYYALDEDIATARAEHQAVPLCTVTGEPVMGIVGRGRLPLADVNASTIASCQENRTKFARKDNVIEDAKTKVDLAGWLARHGYHAVAENDGVPDRRLDGPEGQKLVVCRKGNGHWVWSDTSGQHRGGTIIDYCQQVLRLTVGQTYGELRRALVNPPPPLPMAGRGTPTTADDVPRPARTLAPPCEATAEYLIVDHCLDLTTVQAFAHRLRSDPHDGHLIAPHNDQGDGEEYIPQADGRTRKLFVGSNRLAGEGRGRTLWHGYPRSNAPAMLFLVGESVVSALSGWQKLAPETQPYTHVVSTGGDMSVQGKAKLVRLIQQAIAARPPDAGKVILVDASDVGEPKTQQRADTLAALAAGCGAQYERWATPVGTDWNDAVKADRRAQEVSSEAEAVQAYVVPAAEPQEAQEGPRHSGRGR